MACVTMSWYHRDLSRVRAEELLGRAARDGAFLLRDSESVPGAFALCLLFQNHVHTYRILPDEDGTLAVQTSQGVQTIRFHSLAELVSTYQQPSQGLVSPLLYPVEREGPPEPPEERDYSDVEEERPPLPPRAVPPSAPPTPDATRCGGGAASLLQQRWLDGGGATSVGGELAELVSEYLCQGLAGDTEVARAAGGGGGLPHLTSLFLTTSKRLHSELNALLHGLEALGRLFEPPPSTPLGKTGKRASPPPNTQECDLEQLLLKLSSLREVFSGTEKKVLRFLQDPAPPPPLGPAPIKTVRRFRLIPIQTFEVKLDTSLADLAKIGKSQRYELQVDVEGGRLLVIRKNKESAEEVLIFLHDKVRQLIKSQRAQSKLGIVFERERERTQRRDYAFESPRKREAFCQLMQQMKSRHSKQDEPDLISIFIGTWNMGSSPPPARQLGSWLTSRGLGRTRDETTVAIPHDVYVLGVQENAGGEREWDALLRLALRDITDIDYRMIAVQNLWNMKILVLVKAEHENRISHIQTSSVKTGLANALGNKGAVGVSFVFGGTSFGFVNCHLTSGNEKTHRRNQNYLDILRFLSLGDKRLSSFDITNRFTHLFWFGDLNYRLDMDVQEIMAHINKKEFDALLKVDQLNLEREKNKIFLRFNEEDISFPPTYRYERGTRDSYAWQKFKTTGVRVNVPSWCDRILWKSYPETHIVCNSYGCTDDIVTSDHSPVFATFEVGVTSQFVSKKGSADESHIELESVEAIVKTTSRTKFFLEFYSSCLEGPCKSGENDSQQSEVANFLKVGWSQLQLPLLKPMIADLEYLQDQHILLTVRSSDGYESYGECCLALKSMIGTTPQQFETFLSHRGEETGNVRGWMKVRVPSDRLATRERLYAWISVDNEDVSTAKKKNSSQATTGETTDSAGPPARKPGVPAGMGGPSSYVFMPGKPPGPPQPERDGPPTRDATRKGDPGGEGRGEGGPLGARGPPVRTPADETRLYDEPAQNRSKAEAESAPGKISIDNPNYFILFPGSPVPGIPTGAPPAPPMVTATTVTADQAPADGPAPARLPTPAPRARSGARPAAVSAAATTARENGDNGDEENGDGCPSPNRPPPDYPPPPLPGGEARSGARAAAGAAASNLAPHDRGLAWDPEAAADSVCYEMESIQEDEEEEDDDAAAAQDGRRRRGGWDSSGRVVDTSSMLGLVADQLMFVSRAHRERAGPPGGPPAGPRPPPPAETRPADDRSWFALQMAKSLYEGDAGLARGSGEAPAAAPRPGEREGPPAAAEGARRAARGGPQAVGQWLRALGLEVYEPALVRNGWDDVDYLGDLTVEDLEEVGVADPEHQRLILTNLPAPLADT